MPVVPESQEYRVAITPLKVIRRALRVLGSTSSGENPSGDETEDALEALNGLLDSWNAEEFMVPAMASHSFTLTSGTQTYTIGPAADFDMFRPAQILQGQATIMRSNVEYPLKVCSRNEWAALRLKTQVQTIPSQMFYDNESPEATISFFPIPSADTFILYVPTLLHQFSAVNEIFYLPPAYYEALVYGLALRLWPEYPNPQIFTVVSELAANTKAAAKRLNVQTDPLRIEMADTNLPAGWIDSGAFQRGF